MILVAIEYLVILGLLVCLVCSAAVQLLDFFVRLVLFRLTRDEVQTALLSLVIVAICVTTILLFRS